MKNLILILTLLFTSLGFAKEVPPLKAPVNDLANILSASTAQKLNNTLYSLKKEKGPQVSILTIQSLDGEDIFQYSQKVFETWKLGDEKRDDGLLILISLDRKTRIHVGQGLEGVITDAHAVRILDSLRPMLRNKNFDGALTSAVNQVINLINHEEKQNQKATTVVNKVSTPIHHERVYPSLSDIPKETTANFAVLIFALCLLGGFWFLAHNLKQENKTLAQSEIDVIQSIANKEKNNIYIKSESGKILMTLDEQMSKMVEQKMFDTSYLLDTNEQIRRNISKVENERLNLISKINKYK